MTARLRFTNFGGHDFNAGARRILLKEVQDVLQYWGSDKNYGQTLYQLTYMRHHYKKSDYEGFLENKISIAPLMDVILYHIKVNDDKRDLLFSVIEDRYLPELNYITFDSNRSFDPDILAQAKALNRNHPPRQYGYHDYKIVLSPPFTYEDSKDEVSSEKRIISLYKSQACKEFTERQFGTGAYDAFFKGMQNISYFPTNYVLRLVSCAALSAFASGSEFAEPTVPGEGTTVKEDGEAMACESGEYIPVKKPYRDANRIPAYMSWHARMDPSVFDYVRLRTLGLCAEEIKNSAIQGNIAEAGVFCGHFAVGLNALFPDRKLFLYDSFSGFREEDVLLDDDPREIKKTSWYRDISNISRDHDLIELITHNLPAPESVIFRKGFFPESAEADAGETFALVSIDMDIYKPTLEALRFFYPRLASGGYIFLHDGKFPGVARAINEFKADFDFHIPIVPVCDPAETYVMCKA